MSKRQSGGDKHLGNTKDGTQSFTMTQSANLLDACLNRGRIEYSNCRMEKKKIANRTDCKTGSGNLHFQKCQNKMGRLNPSSKRRVIGGSGRWTGRFCYVCLADKSKVFILCFATIFCHQHWHSSWFIGWCLANGKSHLRNLTMWYYQVMSKWPLLDCLSWGGNML